MGRNIRIANVAVVGSSPITRSDSNDSPRVATGLNPLGNQRVEASSLFPIPPALQPVSDNPSGRRASDSTLVCVVIEPEQVAEDRPLLLHEI
jgi:hypothetical protein